MLTTLLTTCYCCGIDNLACLPLMPSIRLLLRIFLIVVLCADATTGAWAATRMAVNRASQADHANAGAKSKSDCDTNDSHDKTSVSAPTAPASGQDQHEDCDCGSDASCACGCMLTFHPGRTAPLFAAQHALTSVHPAQRLLPVVPAQISRLFRPPIH